MYTHQLYPNSANPTAGSQMKVTPNIIAQATVNTTASPFRPQTTTFVGNNNQVKQQPFYQKRGSANTRGNPNKLPEIAPQSTVQGSQTGLQSQLAPASLTNNGSSNFSNAKSKQVSQAVSQSTSSSVGGGSNSNNSNNNINSNNNNNAGMSLNSSEFNEIQQQEKDERFRYLLKHGTLKRIENNGNIIFCELPQIIGVWVCYRRPCERESNLEKLNLDYMELNHMPLLEGEEKLKILTYQHNRISKIENLVSLPYLLYLDLYDNQVKEIESLQTLLQLRVLLLPKNLLTRVTGLDALQRLEVLDLHSNKIHKIEGVKALVNLKILNLANNIIARIEGIDSLQNLVELNLKLNLIERIEGIANLTRLEKLFLQNNKIDSFDGLRFFKSLHALIEVNLEGNPSHKAAQTDVYYKMVLANAPNLKALDHKSVDVIKDDLKNNDHKIDTEQTGRRKGTESASATSQSSTNANARTAGAGAGAADSNSGVQGNNNNNNSSSSNNNNNNNNNNNCDDDINPEEVIQIIGEQWTKELGRVRALELSNAKKKEYLSNVLVEGGHAEIEDDTSLFIYGNAYEIVLSNEQFQDIIERISFQYIVFDFIIEPSTLATLKAFKKLREISLKDNYLVTLLQLAKLEILPQLRSIQIAGNPLQKCSFLKEFIVYRFPLIQRVNNADVKEADKQKAKALFSNFDKILQLPEKFYNHENIRSYPCDAESALAQDKSYMKLFSKVATDTADSFNSHVFAQFVPAATQSQTATTSESFPDLFDEYLKVLIEREITTKKSTNPLHSRRIG